MASEQMDVDGPDDRTRWATSVLSIDDIEAAQALEGLRSGIHFSHCKRTPERELTAESVEQGPSQARTTSTPDSSRPEPLLSLLTSSHPLISTAINGSVSMYTSSKSYSPRFKTGAEFFERKIGSRVVNAAGTVGRIPGVEGGIRWALQRRESASAAARNETAVDQQTNQTQQMQSSAIADDDMDIEKGLTETGQPRTRRPSNFSTAETLPPYDTFSSPSYEELATVDSKLQPHERSQRQTTWKGRLMISTSGLGVAMSEESLRSLTYCLAWLKWANTRLGNAIVALKRLLQEWENSKREQKAGELGSDNQPRSPALLAQQIQQLKGEVLQTLKQVVDIVSKYAGGALPENARNLVRRHLTSLPRRFRIATTSNPSADVAGQQSDTATNAHRALVLAEEGLDMMSQVSNIVNDTLVSAEGWCDRLRRPRPSVSNGASQANGEMPPPPAFLDDKTAPGPSPAHQQDDVEMGGMEKS